MTPALAHLVELYQAARLRWTEEHPPVVVVIPTAEDPQPPAWCRYCLKRWRPWASSQLDGHAACFVPLAFAREVAAFTREQPLVTWSDMALALDVPIAWIRCWWKVGSGVRDPRIRNA